MPRLAVFPKGFMSALCKDASMKLSEWINLASVLRVEGLEWYAGFLEMEDRKQWAVFRKMVENNGQLIPMLCCSPDFTHPDRQFRRQEIAKQKYWIAMAGALGATYCRVLSGQKRPGLSEGQGLDFAADCILECLDTAAEQGVVLILENHYKDDFWEFPEFAQKMDVFCQLVDRLQHPNFGVNYDPSNTYLAGEDPLELLDRVAHRVVSMHASDRYLTHGTLEDLRSEESGTQGYAERLRHGEIGKGLNDYDAIFSRLKNEGFNGWISIEDGVEGIDQLERSVDFLRTKIAKYWPDFT
jgi:sugar phosphate isomerase/epimerase